MLSNTLSYRLAFIVIIHFLVLLISPVTALPLLHRQDSGTTVQTVHTTETVAGPLTETCVITLTPITSNEGKPAVEEVKRCAIAYAIPGPGDGSGSGTPSEISTPIAGATSASSSASPTPASPTGPASASAAGSSFSIRVNSISTVAESSTQTGVVSSSTAITTTSPSNPATSSSSATAAPDVTATTTNPGNSVTAAAAEQPSGSPAGAFQIPGKQISVLPIGLGVFAGISVIALIVVGLVTYERTKYRKAFRARKLAESGGPMGYGGMA